MNPLAKGSSLAHVFLIGSLFCTNLEPTHAHNKEALYALSAQMTLGSPNATKCENFVKPKKESIRPKSC